MVADAVWDAWLKTDPADQPRTLLAELKYGYEAAGAPAEGTVYLSTRRFRTGPSESPANVSYRPVITQMPRMSRAIDVASQGGQSAYSIAELRLANQDGTLDFLRKLVVDGRAISFYLGSNTWARSDFRLVQVAVVESVAGNETELVVRLRDKRLLLDRDVKGSQVGGSGQDATKYLPLLWGDHKNLEPYLYSDTTNEYSVLSNYGGVVINVRDKGISLRSHAFTVTAATFSVNTGTDVFTRTAHGLVVNDVIFFVQGFNNPSGQVYRYGAPFAGMSARPYWVKSVPTADTFTLSATRGGATLDITGSTFLDPEGIGGYDVFKQRWYDDVANTGRIQLSAAPAGRVTLDLHLGSTGPFALALSLIQTYGNLTADEIDSAAFTAADTALLAKCAYANLSFSIMDRSNLLQELDRLVTAALGWFGDNGLGQITCGLLDTSGLASATAAHSLALSDVLGDVSFENLPPALSRATVQLQLNHTIQTDGISDLVSDADKAFWSQEYGSLQQSTAPSGAAYATNKPLYHKTMVEGPPTPYAQVSATNYGSDFIFPNVPGNFAQEIVDDRVPTLVVFTVKTRIRAYAWALGSVTSFTYRRFGLNAGVNCRIVAIDLDFLEEEVTFQLLAQITPDLTGSFT